MNTTPKFLSAECHYFSHGEHQCFPIRVFTFSIPHADMNKSEKATTPVLKNVYYEAF